MTTRTVAGTLGRAGTLARSPEKIRRIRSLGHPPGLRAPDAPHRVARVRAAKGPRASESGRRPERARGSLGGAYARATQSRLVRHRQDVGVA